MNVPNDLKSLPVKSSTAKFIRLAKGLHTSSQKSQQKPPMDYVYTKGHIRNKRSNLALDLAIAAPFAHLTDLSPENCRVLTRKISIKKTEIRHSSSQPRTTSKLSGKRVRALMNELSKSPQLKTRYKLLELKRVQGHDTKEAKRSLSDSNLESDTNNKEMKILKRPKSRLVFRENSPRNLTPKNK